MTVDKARELVKEVATARRRWGRLTSPPYTMTQIMEALELLVLEAGVFEKPKFTETDYALLKKQLGAAKARLRRHLGGAEADRAIAELSNVAANGDGDHDDSVSV